MSPRILLLLVLALCVLSAQATDYFISPYGDDDNSCTDADSNVCATMSKAHSVASDGDTINVLKGAYTGANNFIKITKSISVVAYPDSTNPALYQFNGQQLTNINGFSVQGNITVKFVGLGFTNWAQYCSYPDCMVGAVDISDTEAALYVQRCLFWNNNNGLTGRAGQLTVQDSTFTSHSNAGLVIASSSGSVNYVTLSNVTMQLGQYGVVIAKINVHLKANRLFISNMTNAINADYMYKSGFNVNIGDSEFSYNTGSALYFSDTQGTGIAGNLIVSNTQFNSNGAQTQLGGALYIGAYMSLAMRNSNVVGNIAIQRGGGLYCENQATVNIDSVDFSANTASDGAAGFCAPQCAFIATSSSSYNNHEKQDTGPCTGITL